MEIVTLMSNVINIDRTPYIHEENEKYGVATKIFIAQSDDGEYALVFEQSRVFFGIEVDTQEIFIPYENLMESLSNIISATKKVLRLVEEDKE